MHPVNGGMCAFPTIHYAFGSLVGYGMGWIYYLGSVTLAPVEDEAAIQYADSGSTRHSASTSCTWWARA